MKSLKCTFLKSNQAKLKRQVGKELSHTQTHAHRELGWLHFVLQLFAMTHHVRSFRQITGLIPEQETTHKGCPGR